jgi:hypothetical protein
LNWRTDKIETPAHDRRQRGITIARRIAIVQPAGPPLTVIFSDALSCGSARRLRPIFSIMDSRFRQWFGLPKLSSAP